MQQRYMKKDSAFDDPDDFIEEQKVEESFDIAQMQPPTLNLPKDTDVT